MYIRAVMIAAAAAAATPAYAVPAYSSMIVFGDSLSDTGNIQSIFGTSRLIRNEIGYGSNGRFSNGAVWHEYLSDYLGIDRAVASRKGGANYAHGGAETDFLPWPTQGTLWQGYDYLLGNGGRAEADALYVAWTGGNDVRDLVGSVDAQRTIDRRLGDLGVFLDNLVASGATSILIPNLPDIGSIPEFRGTSDSASATDLTVYWNQGLASLTADLMLNDGLNIFSFDVFGVFNDILADPAAAGFVNATDTCRSVAFFGLVERSCRDADRFVFWDDVHPTTAAHRQLALNAFSLFDASALGLAAGGASISFADADLTDIPEPAALMLFGLGLLGVGMGRHLKHSREAGG